MATLHPDDRSALQPGEGPPPNPDNMAVATMFFEDNARLIAAGKVQRWEVVKWAVTANLALTTLAIAFSRSGYGEFIFLFASLGTVLISLVLLKLQAGKLYRARGTLGRVLSFMISQGVDYTAITGRSEPDNKSLQYDEAETRPFLIMVSISLAPVALAVLWGATPSVSASLRALKIIP